MDYGQRAELYPPLARPGKAIALEAQIELWSATSRRLAFQFLKTTPRCHETSKTTEAGSADRLDGAGAGCHDRFSVPVAGRRRDLSLDSPFHRTLGDFAGPIPAIPCSVYLACRC